MADPMRWEPRRRRAAEVITIGLVLALVSAALIPSGNFNVSYDLFDYPVQLTATALGLIVSLIGVALYERDFRRRHSLVSGTNS